MTKWFVCSEDSDLHGNYPSEALAVAEAIKLAKSNPDDSILILKTVKAVKSISTVEVIDLESNQPIDPFKE